MNEKKGKKFKNLIFKLKKTSLTLRIIFFISYFFYVVSGIFLSYSLILLTGIENFLRILIIIIFILYSMFYLFIEIIFLLTKRTKWFIFFIIISIGFTIINCIGFYYIYKTYNVVDNIAKENIIYNSVLVALDKNIEIKTVGLVNLEDDIEGYVLPQEYIAKNNKKWVINYYNNYEFLLDGLLNKEVDAIFITANYIEKYLEIEKYQDLASITFIIDKYSKSLKNHDLVETTNKDVTNPFSLLLLGVDSHYEGLTNNAVFNGDTIMLITFNPKTLSATIFSIPRDTYVPIACNNNKEYKINSAAGYGTSCMINTIQNLTGITIDYYMKINFKGVVSLVDALEGITVDVPKPDYPKEYCLEDSNRVYKNICLTPGVQVLNGEKALALARVRHAFIIGDFKRVQNQQLVIEAIIQKAKSIKNINNFYKIINTISHNLDTNLSTKQMLNLYNVGKNILNNNNFGEKEFINIQKTYLTGYTLDVAYNRSITSTFQYYQKSLDEIVEAMNINLENKKAEYIKNFSFSVKEEYEIPIIGKVYSNESKKETLQNFVGLSIVSLENWVSNKNIIINKNHVEDNNCMDGLILEQSESKGTLVSTIKSITVKICKNNNYNNVLPTENNIEQ